MPWTRLSTTNVSDLCNCSVPVAPSVTLPTIDPVVPPSPILSVPLFDVVPPV